MRAHDCPKRQQSPHLWAGQAAAEKATLGATHQLRPSRGEGKAGLGSDHKMQGEEPLGKGSQDRSGGAEGPMGSFLGQ